MKVLLFSNFSISYTDYTHMLFGNASVGFNWGKDKSNTTKWVERDLVFYSKEKGNNTSRGTMILGSLSKRIEGIRGMVNAKCLGFLDRATILQNGESVFNQKYYNNTSYTDLSSSYRKFSLRGRTFLLSVVTYF